MDSDFLLDLNFRKSTSGSIFTLGRDTIIWRDMKQNCIVNSTMETEYICLLVRLLRKLFGFGNS